ncbi:MAG: glycosyltransferase family 4 protein [Anaerolineales bacterium]|jgi:glycosyltransferase involved in cell wall biosynthesis
MNILFLTQIIPYPPDAGPKVKTWHVLRYLVECGHQVTLASFVRPEEESHVSTLQETCVAVHTVPIRRSRPADIFYWLRSHLTGRPFLIERDDHDSMRALVARLLASGKFDVIHADQLTMTQFALPANLQDGIHSMLKNGPVLIFDAHNAVWTIIERMSRNSSWLLRPIIALEAWRVKRYEGLIIRHFDHILAVTEVDRQALSTAAESDFNDSDSSLPTISVIPIAVDTTQLQPITRQPGSANILTLGTLHYPPNADGIRWFMQEVYPLIQRQLPEATLTIIGKNPPKDFLERASQKPQSIHVTGYVPDLIPYFEQAAVMVVPVRAGGGMRVRILEAFAQAMPTVTTTVGLEGIDACPGEEILVADTPSDFASAVVQLLQDESLQTHLATKGRRMAEELYDWRVVLQKMDKIYNQIEPLTLSLVADR